MSRCATERRKRMETIFSLTIETLIEADVVAVDISIYRTDGGGLGHRAARPLFGGEIYTVPEKQCLNCHMGQVVLAGIAVLGERRPDRGN